MLSYESSDTPSNRKTWCLSPKVYKFHQAEDMKTCFENRPAMAGCCIQLLLHTDKSLNTGSCVPEASTADHQTEGPSDRKILTDVADQLNREAVEGRWTLRINGSYCLQA